MALCSTTEQQVDVVIALFHYLLQVYLHSMTIYSVLLAKQEVNSACMKKMKSFLEYLLESQLNEGHFKNEDFAKDDYKYLRPVVSDIVHKGKLGLGDKSVEH